MDKVKQISRDKMLLFFNAATEQDDELNLLGNAHVVLNAFETTYKDGIKDGELIGGIKSLLD